ncbi:Mbeg1-like protein [Clostridium sp. ZS2-4]|uniref:Mbeg1-like protein n=1 Tax=Clostridium sp. ZS2-4 TaxID=2987703 RepID=UPI00227C909E|nr:Mbeg1-like protein [Clostridium sp. ZS2-4]MCY6355662.1 DUF2974 domain-containing protein [Clostridium sp. ZS2-4]
MVTENEYRVLSQLAYIDFHKNKDGQYINKEEYIQRPLSKLQIGKVFKNQNEKDYSKWKDEITKIQNDWKIIGYENKNATTGFVGVAYENIDTGEKVIAFRGTEPEVMKFKLEDLLDDAQLSLYDEAIGKPNQFTDAYNFANNIIGEAKDESKISYTGHSLGGGLCQYAAYKTGKKAVTFNGVGIGQALGLDEEIHQLLLWYLIEET